MGFSDCPSVMTLPLTEGMEIAKVMRSWRDKIYGWNLYAIEIYLFLQMQKNVTWNVEKWHLAPAT